VQARRRRQRALQPESAPQVLAQADDLLGRFGRRLQGEEDPMFWRGGRSGFGLDVA